MFCISFQFKKVFNTFIIILNAYNAISQYSNSYKFALHDSLISNSLIINVLVKANIKNLLSGQGNNYKVDYYGKTIASLTIKKKTLDSLLALGDVTSVEFKRRIYSVYSTLNVNNEKTSLTENFNLSSFFTVTAPTTNGEGVLVGIIDTGIDITHPDFKDSSGNSRIRYIWDQNINNTDSKTNYLNYGKIWTNIDINSKKCAHKDLSNTGHGTAMAGIICSNGLSSTVKTYSGCAPKAEIIFVSLNTNKDRATISDAFNFIISKSIELKKPCVINFSIGDYRGSHDATDLETQLVEEMANGHRGIAIVSAVGNSGQSKEHIQWSSKIVDAGSFLLNDTPNQEVYLYGDTKDFDNINFNLVLQNNQDQIKSDKIFSVNNTMQFLLKDTLTKSGNKMGEALISSYKNESGIVELALRLSNYNSGYKWRIQFSGKGKFDVWSKNIIEDTLQGLNANIVKSNSLKPDNLFSIAGGIQSSKFIITVGSCTSKDSVCIPSVLVKSTFKYTDSLSPNSSIGPNRMNVVKPDIATVGENILSCRDLNLPLTSTINLGDIGTVHSGKYYTIIGGSSSASALVSGYIALILQQNPTLTILEVKHKLRKSSKKNKKISKAHLKFNDYRLLNTEIK